MKSLDFRFMIDAFFIMMMNRMKISDSTAVSFKLNLLRKEINVQFKLAMTDFKYKDILTN